jgi:NAD dependent epimerase/dehydratase family.
MRVLITGVSGFIGSALAEELSKSGEFRFMGLLGLLARVGGYQVVMLSTWLVI